MMVAPSATLLQRIKGRKTPHGISLPQNNKTYYRFSFAFTASITASLEVAGTLMSKPASL